MEVLNCIRKNKELYLLLMNFIETDDDQDQEFHNFLAFIEKQSILADKQRISDLFRIISSIESNYHRFPDFISKLNKFFN